jgi:hypothetical protein
MSDSESEEEETDEAIMDMRLLKAFREKPIRKRKLGRLEAADVDDDSGDRDDNDEDNSDDEDDDDDDEDDDDSEADADSDENEKREMEGEAGDDDDSFEIEQAIGKRGHPIFIVKLCPERGPFRTLDQAKEFMKGVYYLKTIKKTLKMNKKMQREMAVSRDTEEDPEVGR